MRALGNSARMACAASTPPITGMRRSSSVTSGRCWRYSSTACCPLEASATTVISGCMLTMVVTPTRATRWSSATRIRIGSLMVTVPSLPLPSLLRDGSPGAVRRPAARPARACRSARNGRPARKTRPCCSKPRPLSSMRRYSLRASVCSLIPIRLAPACFSTLVTASCAMRSRCCSISCGSRPARPSRPPPPPRPSRRSTCACPIPAPPPDPALPAPTPRRSITERRASVRLWRAMRRAMSRYLRAGVVSSGMHMATASSCEEMPTKPCASVSWISRASRARSSSTSAKR